ncbi:winged helix-turn-helix domain-containing protein [Chitinophaga sp. S165]|uniref:winged helix-turn-helix domain-containing protein n=1 Tax=Chitinophaga sp. S165 TaxID=2135462 RepID=UPI001E5A46A3|nr:winged helix-turn-helix domain-containing protein [Chitinophaga sp. S165]
MVGSDDFYISRKEVLLRKIGHELLLQAGDSTSRVLPVKKIAENEYQISFEKALTFQPDSLVKITRHLLAKDPLTGDYVVNVLNCGNGSVAYGYAISGNEKDNIVTCSKRVQPRGCYMVNIKFKPLGTNKAMIGYLLGGLSFLAFAGFVFWEFVKSRRFSTNIPGMPPVGQSGNELVPIDVEEPAPVGQNTQKFTFGPVLFDAEKRQLIIDKKPMDLTRTETRLLLIFAQSPNETIERSRLQKEIWEDEGVIVGRSLDMFISKLRKKLEFDPNINIVVIRGKGYKFETSYEEGVHSASGVSK